jgi:hypothetical protein
MFVRAGRPCPDAADDHRDDKYFFHAVPPSWLLRLVGCRPLRPQRDSGWKTSLPDPPGLASGKTI